MGSGPDFVEGGSLSRFCVGGLVLDLWRWVLFKVLCRWCGSGSKQNVMLCDWLSVSEVILCVQDVCFLLPVLQSGM